jgi:hypothetical protein
MTFWCNHEFWSVLSIKKRYIWTACPMCFTSLMKMFKINEDNTNTQSMRCLCHLKHVIKKKKNEGKEIPLDCELLPAAYGNWSSSTLYITVKRTLTDTVRGVPFMLNVLTVPLIKTIIDCYLYKTESVPNFLRVIIIRVLFSPLCDNYRYATRQV